MPLRNDFESLGSEFVPDRTRAMNAKTYPHQPPQADECNCPSCRGEPPQIPANGLRLVVNNGGTHPLDPPFG